MPYGNNNGLELTTATIHQQKLSPVRLAGRVLAVAGPLMLDRVRFPLYSRDFNPWKL